MNGVVASHISDKEVRNSLVWLLQTLGSPENLVGVMSNQMGSHMHHLPTKESPPELPSSYHASKAHDKLIFACDKPREKQVLTVLEFKDCFGS